VMSAFTHRLGRATESFECSVASHRKWHVMTQTAVLNEHVHTRYRSENCGDDHFADTERFVCNHLTKFAVQLRIREVPGSSLGPKTGYPHHLRGFRQSLQVNRRIVCTLN
jgi:hypothetical protein